MFNFGRKKEKDEKEKKKKDKKERRKQYIDSMSQDELTRLDELRKSLGAGKASSPEKLSGITADYRDQEGVESGGSVSSKSSSSISSMSRPTSLISPTTSTSSIPPPLPARPPPKKIQKKSILKSSKTYDVSRSVSSDLDDAHVLLKNTKENSEYINVYKRAQMLAASQSPTNKSKDNSPASSGHSNEFQENREAPFEMAQATVKVRVHSDHVSPVSPKLPLSPIQASALNGESVGIKQRPLSSLFPMHLPNLVQNGDEETLREITIEILSPEELKIKQSFVKNKSILLIESSGFVPGDQLVAVNGTNVQNLDRDEVQKLIKTALTTDAGNQSISLKVKSSQECSELVKQCWAQDRPDADVEAAGGLASSPRKIMKAKTEDQLENEKAFLEADRVWLIHRDGFAAAGLLKDEAKGTNDDNNVDGEGGEGRPAEGMVRVQLDSNGDIFEVEEDDVELANPPGFDKVEDLAQLRYLNESSVLHVLRQRYGNNLIHTFAGPSIISINPTTNLAIYSEKIIQMFKECPLEDMPPHIYAVAQTAYRTMLRTRKDQSVAFIGRSGSGKSTNARHALHALVLAAGSPNQAMSLDKINAINILLESFGTARTIMNSTATRFSSMISLDYDTLGHIVSASLQTMMLEKSRVIRRPEGEPTFNIFYQMLAGLDNPTKKELFLDNLNEPNLFLTPLQRMEDKSKANLAFQKIHNVAFKTLGIKADEANSLWSVLAAIYHLGVASVAKGNLNRTQFAKPQAAQKAAHCLGTSLDDLSRTIFQGNTSSSTLSRKLRSADKESANLPDGIESLEGFVMGLYQEVFNAIVYMINRSISTTANASNTIFVLDTPGFQNPATCGRIQGATFEELCHNYSNERLQLMFHERTIASLYEKYAQEQVECDTLADIEELPTPAPLVALIDKQAGVRVSSNDLASADRRGLLWLLDEEAIFPGATDESFVERLMLQYGQRGSEDLLRPGPIETNKKNFVLQHFQGTNPVLYNADGWLQASREDAASRSAGILLQESNKSTLSDLFLTSRGPMTSLSGSVAGLEGSHSLRRMSSMRRTFTSGQAGIKRNSVALQVKFQVDGLCEQLRRTKIHFVHCFLPQHGAGLCDIKSKPKTAIEEGQMNVPLVRSQLRGAQILDAVRLHKNGFPENLNYGEFWRRYRILSDELQKRQPTLTEMKASVEDLLADMDLDKSAFRLGNTQVFLRAGVLSHLDEEREDKLRDQVIRFQAVCRGYLARRQLQKLKTQDIAIRCIQKNVRKFMGVREWPWWRLLIKITPMLNVHRTENQLKSQTEELETLRSRFEKMEKERSELKQHNEKLESRLSEMAADLAEEHSTATLATERLEAEQADRMKLEKDKGELETRNKQLHSTNERMEMELLYSRALDMNGSNIEDDDGMEPTIYKQKYERAMKELEYLKQRLQQQHEDDLEQLMALKKQLEKKLNDAYEEVDEQRQVVAQWKRKTQKVNGELNDTKLLLEEQTSRNVLLEKKQRKFDAEIGLLQEDRKQESNQREKLQREVDALKAQKYGLDEQIHAMKLDLDYKEEKINSLNKEIEDLQHGGATDEEVAGLKRQKADLEGRLKDQEEELDDLAGQVQMLEAAKTKLEMSMAAIKKEHRREVANKEEELEDIRAAAQKKIKALEQQLENEHEERINFVREKHELETRIINLQEMASRSADEEQVSKLKKDLKRTKALLKDAQLMVERSRNESSNKVVLRQLKNQLEDAEFAKTAAVKAKQNLELELSDVQTQLDDIMRSKSDVEDRLMRLSREKTDLSSQLEENEEELQEVMKKYKASVSQLSVDQITIQEQSNRVSDLEDERNKLKEQVAELSTRISSLEGEHITNPAQSRLELKVKELESKLELEQTTRGRMDTQINRLKEAIEKLNHETDSLRHKEAAAQDSSRKLQRQLRELKEDYANLQQKETETNAKKSEYEKLHELAEAETITARNDLKLALKRIEDLQTAINGELDSELSDLNSDGDSDSSEEGMENFLEHHRRAVSVQRERESVSRDSMAREVLQREVRASVARESVARQLETMPEEPELKLSNDDGLLDDEDQSHQDLESSSQA